MKIPFVPSLLGALLFATLSAQTVDAKGGKTERAADPKVGKTEKAADPKVGKTEKVAEAKPAQVIEISVTKEGFLPKEVKVKVGQPVKLQVTRRIDKTCAKEIVIKDYGINEPLPLDKTVTVTFTPSKTGPTRFACAMDMIAGVIVAE